MITNEKKLRSGLDRKKVLIVGGMGMLGSNLAHRLVDYNAKVTVADAFIEPYGANMFNLNGIAGKVDLNIADVRDKEAMKILVRDKDIIFNFAAQVSHNDSISDPFLDADINYMGHLCVLESMKRYNPDAKILFSGSRLQYGRIRSNPVDENHPLCPETPYAVNKLSSEFLYNYYNRIWKIPTVVFRIANPYGMRCQMKHSKYSIINYFIRQAMENKGLMIFGDGEQIRDYIFINDLVDAFLLAAIGGKATGKVYNVGSGRGVSFKDMVKLVAKVVGSGKIKHMPWPQNYINVETGDYIANISKISKDLGWTPLVSLEEGVKKTVSYYKKFKKHYF